MALLMPRTLKHHLTKCTKENLTMENIISIEAIANEIRARRPDLEVSVNEVVKNKQTLQGLTIKSAEAQIAPNIYVQQYIEEFQDLGTICDSILNTYE